MATQCPLCGSHQFEVFLHLPGMPAQDGVVYDSQQAAVSAPVGDISLAVCRDCHYIGNLAYDPALVNFVEYSYSKINSQHYRNHVDAVVAMLVNEYAIRNKTVMEVGCGEAYFLDQLCKAGDNLGIGIDPSLSLRNDVALDHSRLNLIREFYSGKHAQYARDLVCCRHVIDELAEPLEFLQLILTQTGSDHAGLVYLELPNALHTFEQKLIWNVGYAKRSWFTSKSLQKLLKICGLGILSERTLFEDEYLGVVAGDTSLQNIFLPNPRKRLANLFTTLEQFADHANQEVQRWQRRVDELAKRGEQMVVWGAGMRGINFLHQFGDPTIFPKIVDINPDRQGRFLPRSGYLVESPQVLTEVRPGRILISNPNFKAEICAQLQDMELDCEIELL